MPLSNEEALFTLALAKPAAERAAWPDCECGEDEGLRQRVEALLAAHERQSGFLPGKGTTESTATLLDKSTLTEDPVRRSPDRHPARTAPGPCRSGDRRSHLRRPVLN